MAVRLSRRAGPEHPVLFDPERDIPMPPRPPTLPAPSAEADIASFRAVLEAADAMPLAHLARVSAGRSVTVGGARRVADPLLPGEALLDDGSAVVPIILRPGAPASLRAALGLRFLVAVGCVAEYEGFMTLVAEDVRDLRQLDREWQAIARR